MIPQDVLELVEGSPDLDLPGIPACKHECEGSRFHSPRPMLVRPFAMPDAPGGMMYLCGTCADNVHLLLALLNQGEVPWSVRRYFGNIIRAVATVKSKEGDHV